MGSIQEEILRATAAAGDKFMVATAAWLRVLASDLRDLVASMQLCAPLDESHWILPAAAEHLEDLAEAMRQHPGAAREIATQRLRKLMRVVEPASPEPEPALPPEALWRMLGALAGDGATLLHGKRDRQSLLRAAAIAARQLEAATDSRGKEARRLALVRSGAEAGGARSTDIIRELGKDPNQG